MIFFVFFFFAAFFFVFFFFPAFFFPAFFFPTFFPAFARLFNLAFAASFFMPALFLIFLASFARDSLVSRSFAFAIRSLISFPLPHTSTAFFNFFIPARSSLLNFFFAFFAAFLLVFSSLSLWWIRCSFTRCLISFFTSLCVFTLFAVMCLAVSPFFIMPMNVIFFLAFFFAFAFLDLTTFFFFLLFFLLFFCHGAEFSHGGSS